MASWSTWVPYSFIDIDSALLITPSSIQSLMIFLGPIILPNVLTLYRTFRSIRSTPPTQIRAIPTKTSYALGVLFISGLIAFISTLPFFSPENIFRLTQSRLGTTGGVLLTRLAALRNVTAADEKLRKVFDAGGLDARLLYARFGPDILLNCPLVGLGEKGVSEIYLACAAPLLLAPHLLHLLALGVATSGMLVGKDGARWRTLAIISGIIVGAADFRLIASYDDGPNTRTTRVNDIDFVYWKMQVWRGLGIAAVDGILGWSMWLQATGRAFLPTKTNAERLLDHTKHLETTLGRTRSLGIVRNGCVRDAGLRKKIDGYWVKEGEVTRDIFEEPEVLEAQRQALRRMDATRVGREADVYLDTIFGGMPAITNGLPT